jgi:ATP-binding cassette subfamily F protein 3
MLHVNDLTYRIEGRELLLNASVHIPAGHKIGIVGRNGVGKSTFLRLIDGTLQPDAGIIRIPKGLRMASVAQEAPNGPESLVDTVLAADQERTGLLAELEGDVGLDRMGIIHDRLQDIDAYGAPSRAATILAGLGFDEAAQQRPCAEYSGGWRMRVALAAVLFLEPDLLLLDEPTNYLDLEGAIWLESYLKKYRHTVLLVSHDRDLLNQAVDGILHIQNAGFTLYRGGYDTFDRVRRERLILAEKARRQQDKQRKHIQSFVDRFRYKASKAKQAQSRLKALERMEPMAATIEDPSQTFILPKPTELAPPLIAVEGGAVGYEEGRPILRKLSFTIGNDDRIALLGKNGNGKSTLAKLLTDRLKLMDGSIHRNDKLEIGYFAQHQIEDLEPEETAVEHLRKFLPGKLDSAVRGHLGAFGLTQARADTRCDNLSGGEKARLVLARITTSAPQLLVLDEPTNHLDVDAREALIRALNDYPGSIVIISHDRHFVELVADRLWLVADGSVQAFEGSMTDYQNLLLGSKGGSRNFGDPTENTSISAKNRKTAKRDAAKKRAQLAPLRKALKQLEKEIAAKHRDIEALKKTLANPVTYENSEIDVAEISKRQNEIIMTVAELEERWLELSENIESNKKTSEMGAN